VVFAGFAGSLSSSLRVGDVILATEVAHPDGHCITTTWPQHENLPGVAGRLLTTPLMVSDPVAKRALGAQHHASAVDMESFHFAARCGRQGVRFGCVRAISDNHDTALSPELVPLLSAGVVSPWRFALALLRRPRLIREMLRLARDTRVAARELDRALTALLHADSSGAGS
jgi:adenosylhomocysteine nucleosidase